MHARRREQVARITVLVRKEAEKGCARTDYEVTKGAGGRLTGVGTLSNTREL